MQHQQNARRCSNPLSCFGQALNDPGVQSALLTAAKASESQRDGAFVATNLKCLPVHPAMHPEQESGDEVLAIVRNQALAVEGAQLLQGKGS